MANIQNELNNIKNATFGKEVRGSIHDGIDAINKEVESTTGRQVDLEKTFDQLVINAGNSNAEIVDARVKSDGTSYPKLGDRLNEVDSQLEQNKKKQFLVNSITNFRHKKDNFFGMYSKNVIGDSISQGFNSSNFLNNSWGGIMRKLINQEYGTDNIGFVSFSTSNTDFHTLNYSTGTWSERSTADGSYLGLIKWSSSDSSAIFKITPKVNQKIASICYECQADGGILDVYVDGSKRFSIDTSQGTVSKVRKSDAFNISQNCLIELRKADNKLTTFSGIWYSNESQASAECMFNNYARSGAKLVDIDNKLLDVMCDADIVFFAIGHNDCYGGASIEDFKRKINYVIDKIKSNGCFLVVLDFIWKYDESNEFRQELIRLADEVENSIYIEPAKLYNFDNETMISKGFFASSSDTSHPTDFGHKYVAELTAKTMNLSNTTNIIKDNDNAEKWHYIGDSSEPTFENSWANTFSANKYKTKYKKVGSLVFLEIYVTGGTKDSVVFTLPEGYRPNFTFSKVTKNEVSGSNILFVQIEVGETGKVNFKSNYSYTNYSAIICFSCE